MKLLKYSILLIFALSLSLPVCFIGTPSLAATPASKQNVGAKTASTLASGEQIPQSLINAAKKEGKVVYWGTDSPKEGAMISAAFNEKYPFIKVQYTKGSGQEFADRIIMEANAKKCTVDYVNAANESIITFRGLGLLRNISDLPHMKIWPKEAKDPKGYWFATHRVVFPLCYNTNLVSAAEVPKSYEELLHPKWKEQIAIEERPDFWFLGVWQAWGPEKAAAILKKVMQNKPYIGRGYSAIAELLLAGQFKLMFPYMDYNISKLIKDKAPVNWAALNLTEVTYQGAFIMKDAPHPHAAELFVRWLMSLEGSSATQKITDRAPLHPGAKAAFSPLGDFPKNTEFVYRVPESFQLLQSDSPMMKLWNREVRGL